MVIKPANIFKGQGLCKLVVESTDDRVSEDRLYQDQSLFDNEVCYITVNND
jgi:hypothetical protein